MKQLSIGFSFLINPAGSSNIVGKGEPPDPILLTRGCDILRATKQQDLSYELHLFGESSSRTLANEAWLTGAT